MKFLDKYIINNVGIRNSDGITVGTNNFVYGQSLIAVGTHFELP